MASRIYPITSNPRNLELLCGFPEGTAARLEQWEKDNPEPGWNDQEAGFARWNKLQNDKHLSTLDHFKTFGWGRVDHRIVGPEGYSGEIPVEQVAEFMKKHGRVFTPEQIAATEGICWG